MNAFLICRYTFSHSFLDLCALLSLPDPYPNCRGLRRLQGGCGGEDAEGGGKGHSEGCSHKDLGLEAGQNSHI